MTQQQNNIQSSPEPVVIPSFSPETIAAYTADAHRLRGEAVQQAFSTILNAVRRLAADFRQLFALVPPYTS